MKKVNWGLPVNNHSEASNSEAMLAEYVELGEQIKQLEARRSELRKPLEILVMAAPEQTVVLGSLYCSGAEVERENFNLKQARTNLSPVDLEKLKPFISTTKYIRLNSKVVK
jgi:hypothetical protein